MKTLEKGVKYVQSQQQNTKTISVTYFTPFLVFLLLTLNK